MAVFARWQWDDLGVYRDFAEQYQAEMESAFQSRTPWIEVEIPPFGTFKMNLQGMTQTTVKGRNVGYTRKIRRQTKQIEIGYFLLGYEGEMIASESPVDNIDQISVVEVLEMLLGKIVSDPEDFSNRSVNLAEEPFKETIGNCSVAVELLQERGFEMIQEGPNKFLVFMQDDILGIKDAHKEVVARLERLRKSPPKQMESNAVEPQGETNSVQSTGALEESNQPTPMETTPSNTLPADSNDRAARTTTPKRSAKKQRRGQTGRVWRVKNPTQSDSNANPAGSTSTGSAVEDVAQEGPESGPMRLTLHLPSGQEKLVELKTGTLEELLDAAKSATTFRLPGLSSPSGTLFGVASEPGAHLGKALQLKHGSKINVDDFEVKFVERMQKAILRVQDLAMAAPLLDWEKPELLKMLLGRLQVLLQDSCDAWCRAAGCTLDQELLCGRALLLRLYGDRPLGTRLDICRQLLAREKKDQKLVVKVQREDLIGTTLNALAQLPTSAMRKMFCVEFIGEIAEDYGGPRRDFFASLGGVMVKDLPEHWRRTPNGSLAPVADVITSESPKAARRGLAQAEDLYRACGRACALAVRHKDTLGEEFAHFFLHQVARDDTVGLEELQKQLSEADADDVRSHKEILTKGISETGLEGQTLSRTITGSFTEVELVPGGKNLPLTDDNKAQWLELHLHNKLYGSLKHAADAFRQGILDVFGGTRRTCPLLVLLTPIELGKLWAGSPVNDEALKRWEAVTTVSDEVNRQASWLWEVLQESDDGQRAKVLKFSTGSGRIGQGGLSSFEVQPADGGDDALPRAMTCANMLQLPRYSSKDVLKTQLSKATELCDSFQIL